MANRMINDNDKETAMYYKEEVEYLKKLISKII